ncbi:MAG: histidine kinase [Rhizobiales bacterium 17-65-6]|nr:MAG: histidine kinase [Rhizobiales bacterium 12-68-15]OYX89484.1 MAG: histidine kinase [Azorhizobium sp. 32-67-21]OZA00286.1 MAG: histidine kinase [Rhizobiales bacterium 17-65-6]
MTQIKPDTTGNENLFLLVQLRWLAVVGQVLTILIVAGWYRIPLPLLEMASVLVFLVTLNVVSLWRYQRSDSVNNAELFFEMLLDVAALTMQLHLSGGAHNPFIALYLLQVSLAAVLLETWSAWTLAVAAGAGFIWLTQSFRPLAIPDEADYTLFGIYIQGAFICFALTASLLVLFITRINRNLRARDAHLADLRQKSAEEDLIVRMGLLTSGAAHELGTPLATLSVILSDWKRMPQFRGDPELADELGEMQAQLSRCKAIVSGILMSSGEARGEGMVRTTAAAFFDELVAEWRISRSPKVLDYTCDLPPDLPFISDPALKQVIFNVFDNALEASPLWVGVAVRGEGDQLVITVRDAGPGFAAEILETFGKPYRSTKNRTGGGLGLFLVVNVVRKLGGSVEAVNGAAGARVTITLPMQALSHGGEDGP